MALTISLGHTVHTLLSRSLLWRLARWKGRTVGWEDFSLWRSPPWTRHPGLPGTGGFLGMWNYSAKTRDVPGKLGQIRPLIAFRRATFSMEITDRGRWHEFSWQCWPAMTPPKWQLTFHVFKKRSRMEINDYQEFWALGEEGILKVGSVRSIKETIWECSGAFSYLTTMTKPLNTSCSVPCFSEIRFSLLAEKVAKNCSLFSSEEQPCRISKPPKTSKV